MAEMIELTKAIIQARIPIEIVANAKGSPTIRPKENVDLFP